MRRLAVRLAAGGVALAVTLAATPVLAVPPPGISGAVLQAGPETRAPTSVAVEPTGKRHHAKGDPLEGFNRAMFSVHQFFDRLFFRPAAKAYEKVVPKVVRKGVRHFFSNLQEPIVFANDVLQLKPKRALRTLARFSINSTLGIGGLLDVAKAEGPAFQHHDNGFGNTLGRYGIGPGPYLFLPLVGPSTLRDFGSGIAEGQALPFTIGTPFDRAEYRISEPVLTGLDLRAEADGALKALLGGAVDPYATLRSAYLQDRAASIAELRHTKKTTASPLDDPLTDPAGEPAAGTAAPEVTAAEAVPEPDPATPVIDVKTTPPPPVSLTPIP